MTAAWIALEDVQAGSGELQYVPGSHRLPDYVFASGRLDQNGGQAGELDGYNRWLAQQIAAHGLTRATFLPKKGDVLMWHAGLAHGGSPITTPGATRQSLVGHFCPKSARPRSWRPRARRRHGRLVWSNHVYKQGWFFF
jgi:ectoine hydroxylase-related dioxygenase (phytanoyl-CoA dioxygenase family)